MYVETTLREARTAPPIEGVLGHGVSLKTLMADYERRLIVDALNAAGWHQRRAAARLGVLPTTLLEKMKRLGIRRARAVDPLVVVEAPHS
jgi:DNA-binding NtrC family response regulator